MSARQCNKEEFEYILKDTVDLLNKNRLFKKNKLHCYGTQFYNPTLKVIKENHKKHLKLVKSTGNWTSQLPNKDTINLLNLDFRIEEDIFGFKPQYEIRVDQKFLKQSEKSSDITRDYFFYLDGRFWDREHPRKTKQKSKQAYTIDKLPDNLSASLSKFCDFLLKYKKKKLSFEDEMDLYELTNFGNPWELEFEYQSSFLEDYDS